jgi:hypothetical protein
MNRIACIAIMALLSGCASKAGALRPSDVKFVEVPVPYYVPIPAKMLRGCDATEQYPQGGWPKAVKPSQSMAAAQRRGECATQYEGQLEVIGTIEGRPVPEPSQ